MRPLDQALVMCSRGHQVVTAIRKLQPFRYLHDCSDCFRLERIAGWGLHPLESAAFFTAHAESSHPTYHSANYPSKTPDLQKRPAIGKCHPLAIPCEQAAQRT